MYIPIHIPPEPRTLLGGGRTRQYRGLRGVVIFIYVLFFGRGYGDYA